MAACSAPRFEQAQWLQWTERARSWKALHRRNPLCVAAEVLPHMDALRSMLAAVRDVVLAWKHGGVESSEAGGVQRPALPEVPAFLAALLPLEAVLGDSGAVELLVECIAELAFCSRTRQGRWLLGLMGKASAGEREERAWVQQCEQWGLNELTRCRARLTKPLAASATVESIAERLRYFERLARRQEAEEQEALLARGGGHGSGGGGAHRVELGWFLRWASATLAAVPWPEARGREGVEMEGLAWRLARTEASVVVDAKLEDALHVAFVARLFERMRARVLLRAADVLSNVMLVASASEEDSAACRDALLSERAHVSSLLGAPFVAALQEANATEAVREEEMMSAEWAMLCARFPERFCDELLLPLVQRALLPAPREDSSLADSEMRVRVLLEPLLRAARSSVTLLLATQSVLLALVRDSASDPRALEVLGLALQLCRSDELAEAQASYPAAVRGLVDLLLRPPAVSLVAAVNSAREELLRQGRGEAAWLTLAQFPSWPRACLRSLAHGEALNSDALHELVRCVVWLWRPGTGSVAAQWRKRAQGRVLQASALLREAALLEPLGNDGALSADQRHSAQRLFEQAHGALRAGESRKGTRDANERYMASDGLWLVLVAACAAGGRAPLSLMEAVLEVAGRVLGAGATTAVEAMDTGAGNKETAAPESGGSSARRVAQAYLLVLDRVLERRRCKGEESTAALVVFVLGAVRCFAEAAQRCGGALDVAVEDSSGGGEASCEVTMRALMMRSALWVVSRGVLARMAVDDAARARVCQLRVAQVLTTRDGMDF